MLMFGFPVNFFKVIEFSWNFNESQEISFLETK